MKININSFCNYSVSFFKERIQTTLTAQQQKILSIVGIALGLLAACYVVKRYCLTRCSSKPLNGEETKTLVDGTVLKGQFENGFLKGQGKKIYSDGKVEEGEFKEGKLHGPGKRTCRNGRIEEGQFEEGKL